LSGGSKHLELLFAGVAKTVVVAVFDVSRQAVCAVVDAVGVAVVASEFRVVVHAVGIAVRAGESDGVAVTSGDSAAAPEVNWRVGLPGLVASPNSDDSIASECDGVLKARRDGRADPQVSRCVALAVRVFSPASDVFIALECDGM
jgi:hypothetical protein